MQKAIDTEKWVGELEAKYQQSVKVLGVGHIGTDIIIIT